MQSYGIMVSTWPIVLGCDAGGVVVEVGQAAASTFKVGDEVCGCTRLGIPGYGTFQEYVGALLLCSYSDRPLQRSYADNHV